MLAFLALLFQLSRFQFCNSNTNEHFLSEYLFDRLRPYFAAQIFLNYNCY